MKTLYQDFLPVVFCSRFTSEIYTHTYIIYKTNSSLISYFLVFSNPAKSQMLEKLWKKDSKMVNAFLSKEIVKMNRDQRIAYLRTVSDNAIDKNDDEGHTDRQRNNHYDTRIGSLKKNRRLKEWQLLMGMSVQESPVKFDEDFTASLQICILRGIAISAKNFGEIAIFCEV